jgi:uncharacterized membrane protein YfcA
MGGYTAWRMFRNSLIVEQAMHTGAVPPLHKGAVKEFACQTAADSPRLSWTMPCAQALAATGMVSGLLSGMLGAGGGFVIVPALSHFTNLPTRSIFATSLAVISLVSVSGVVSASLGGSVNWMIAAPFGLGAVVALLVGRVVTKRLKSAHLMQAFSVVASVVAVMLFAKGSGWMR